MNVTVSPGEIIEILKEEQLVDLPPGFGAEDDLFDAGLDSMAVMQLIVVIEERYGVALGAADASREALGTPARLAATIESRR